MDFCKKLVVWLVVLSFSFVGVAPAFSGSRIIPTGTVKVYESKKLVQVLKQESAFPIGSMLTTEGKCGVRMENFYLVAEDGSTFGVAEGVNRMDLRVDKGVVYFAITQGIGNLNFLTPAGVLSAEQIKLHASANGGVLKGYLDVGNTEVKMGVLEGGSIILATAGGEKMIRPGKQLTLALADPVGDKNEATEAKTDDDSGAVAAADSGGGGVFGDIPTAYLAGGAALGAAALIGLAASGGSSPASPVSP